MTIKLPNLNEELENINSKDVKKFTKEALINAPEQFWTCACSGSGKFHPPEDQGKGGLIRHIKKGTAVIGEYAKRAHFNTRETDFSYSAFLLHDIKKNGDPWEKTTDYQHGIIAAEWLDNNFKLKDKTGKQMILDAIRYHMAPWVTVFSNKKTFSIWDKSEDIVFTGKELGEYMDELVRALLNPSRIELAVREADYWASRKKMSFLPGKNIVYNSKEYDNIEERVKDLKKSYGIHDSPNV
ncbi:HD domain-containing protein [Candidatus Woesearchaeota archaeon]|nr:HD domain-containing protein [Candidatus Woesearchaeota archaeon]